VALQGALQLGWMVYRAYQPTLLGSFGFGGWVFASSLLPGLVGLVVDPLAGALSDRLRGEGRGRVVQISLAVLVAGMLFLTIVGLVGSALPRGLLLLPALMLAWQIAVQIAASPNLALLQDAAPFQALPRLAALSVFVQGLIGAFESPLTRWALQAGPALTFILAAGVLLLGLAPLRAAVPLLPAAPGEARASGVDLPCPQAPGGGRPRCCCLRWPPVWRGAWPGSWFLLPSLGGSRDLPSSTLLLPLVPRGPGGRWPASVRVGRSPRSSRWRWGPRR